MNKQSKFLFKKHKYEEKEIKIQISKNQYNKLLNQRPLESTLIKPIKQKDVYYDREDMYITNLNRGLRVRFKEDIPQCLEFKSLFWNQYTQGDNPWFIEEITFPIPLKTGHHKKLFLLLARLDLISPTNNTDFSEQLDFSKIEQILFDFNLKPMIVVNKNRVGYQYNQAQYIFDYIEGLGYFLEIESEGQNPIEILNKLQIENYQIIRNGYNDMLAEHISSYLSNEEKQSKFKKNSKWNILPSEEKIVEKMLSYYK